MKCERCGSDTRIQVQAVISAPGELAHQFSKQNLRRKDVYLVGVLWETADFICTNPECGKVVDGYGNYVTNLQKEVDRLKAKYEPETPNALGEGRERGILREASSGEAATSTDGLGG